MQSIMLDKRSTLHCEGKNYSGIQPAKTSLSDAFGKIRYIMLLMPHTIESVTATEICITEHHCSAHHVSFPAEVDGVYTRLKSEKETFFFSGDAEVMRPLLEFLYLLYREKPANPIPVELVEPFEFTKPSWLPVLLLFELNLGLFGKTEQDILIHYGIDSALIAALKEKKVPWFDLVEINRWWFERPGTAFADLIREMIPTPTPA